MHLLYKTPAIILCCRDIGESERIFSVFSKEFGKLDILGRGIRNCLSKLRPNMNLFSLVNVGFVSRKNSWLLTDAKETDNFYAIKKDDLKLRAAGAIAVFLNRFIHGPEKDLNLWHLLVKSLKFLADNSLSEPEIRNFELYFKLRTLVILGYTDERIISKLNDGDFDKRIFEEINRDYNFYLQILNKAVKESQL
jgi:DNA repair protein RecO (recombination protein O)